MQTSTPWPEDPIFVEIGVTDGSVALGLREAGYSKYLGVCGDARRIAALQARHPDVAGQLTCSRRRKLVLNNNADVLILSGPKMLHVWKYRSVRHSQYVAWRFGWNLYSLAALVGCLCYMLSKRYSRPRLVALRAPGGETSRLLVSRILRHRLCHRNQLHFIPHSLGLADTFRRFDERSVRYVVLRWFERLPEIEPAEDIDVLVDDDSLDEALQILGAQPGIQPCDVYSQSGLARSAYCGTPYYPSQVARRILDGAVRHKDLCMVPNRWDYFHSLAYHAVYHKGPRSNLSWTTSGSPKQGHFEHDYATILKGMADSLDIRVDISLEGLHTYLQETNWGPAPEMLARLAAACWRNKWLRAQSQGLGPHIHDQGLTVFVLRQAAIQRGFQDQMIDMIRQNGFDILATKVLSDEDVKYAAARTRGGNWGSGGPFDLAGGPPAVAIVAYDPHPLPMTRRQRRKFSTRTNARIFIKESIRDAIIAQLPANQSFNALHSSDHAAEAWHLIEVLAPQLIDDVRNRLRHIHQSPAGEPALRRAA